MERELEKILRCPVERGKPLARLTTLGVGGQAELYVEPADLEDLRTLWLLAAQEGVPVRVLGGGSNVIFPDGTTPGVVLSTRRWAASSWQEQGDDVEVEVQAGYPLPALVDEAVRRGLGGLEFAVGIPGTVGGALAGNAGAGGRGICGLLTEVATLESDGSLRRWRPEEFSCAYRSFSLAEEGRLFLACQMRLSPLPREEVEAELARFRSLRAAQPQGVRSAGCTFKNPPGDSAGRLLDRYGCKGMTAGDAVVSDRHANFILNRGRASSSDVVELIWACRKRVFEGAGVWLEPEIRFVGFGGGEPLFDEGKDRLCAG